MAPFLDLPPYTESEKNHLNISCYFYLPRESNPGRLHSKQEGYPLLHCLSASNNNLNSWRNNGGQSARTSYVQEPLQTKRCWIGLDVALEVDVVSGPDAVGVQGSAQSEGHLWSVCKRRSNDQLGFEVLRVILVAYSNKICW